MSEAWGVILFTERRELRRSMFDALDGGDDIALYSARDLAHLRSLLDEHPPLALMVVEIDGHAGHGLAAVEALRALPLYARVPLICVLPDAAALQFMPADTVDWVRAEMLEDELLARARRAMASVVAHPPAPYPPPPDVRVVAAPVPAPVLPVTSGTAGDYRFAFDAGCAWIVAAAGTGRIIEVGDAFARLFTDAAFLRDGATVGSVFRLSNGTPWPAANADALLCSLCRPEGVDIPGEIDIRRIEQAGEHRIAIAFRDFRSSEMAERALSLLSLLDASASDDEGMGEAAAMLADALELDVVAIWSTMIEGDSPAPPLIRLWNGPGTVVWPEEGSLPLLMSCLAGNAVVRLQPSDVGTVADPLVDALSLNSFAFLPLIDERRAVLGAMFVGRRRALDDARVLEPALRAASSRFASALELRRTREQGRAKGLLDGLTGLPNRLLFNDRLDTTIREAQRTGECFAALFVDLDRFKSINDTLGHSVGDQVLSAVARRLRASVRASDTVARYAGDEFTLILRHIIKRDDVLRIAEKIVQVMETPLPLDDGSELQMTVSIGVAFFPDDASDGEHLLRHADEAMYGAKSLGRNNFQIYAPSSDLSQQQHVALKAKLRHAERNGELRVFYQPQVDTMTEDIVGMEALVRWEHPELGTISPAFFIPLAEASGLIVSIGEWVMRTACAQAHAWEKMFGLRLRLGVNLSAVQLMQPNLVATVAGALIDTGLDPSCLELEVTESISVKTVPHLVESLDALHAMGCRIAIDDFGTGAASLDYLRRLPADRIKIDQSFVRNIGVDPDDEAIVRATIDMAHRLKRGVVAEGVEIEQHLNFLRANGCDELQGYLFCRPLPAISFEKLLGERQRLLTEGLAPAGSA
ncbi:diguanylate cyclase (GGDEF)-like protein [Luteibacter sp. Sphag1AF]|uniref:putative bifunctional diguanylate cyclase/phosphodiesterase n=1 Tax=Luteibacter sp. Sphag1AF TaxID=2587031 RepID=UPI0016075C2C|nr:bifunctional diguanylate cyclase/phosphodiesterase [Luteibacter sp. Sphag1AF]MBB3228464.1 diguanylate cyclase (GGDEF)-like protein [Luteibacter sp. Sphag1AF]